ncbi:uncharacterized protein BYT42DRAFT_568016 [Radiomyces spectabilis]|uniref:uncharacterized protein n=1 Tax=Radiomyces spectabilis TaxID=64574 RepID=UPI00221FC52F|nr:uncharacterized protein BYT42DRAFT_568016 [Radiomyces spectabilis]KAI8379212.1 hypothetical protein BYT42DRAFT_568016 [Radiomyces spectabilis]
MPFVHPSLLFFFFLSLVLNNVLSLTKFPIYTTQGVIFFFFFADDDGWLGDMEKRGNKLAMTGSFFFFFAIKQPK